MLYIHHKMFGLDKKLVGHKNPRAQHIEQGLTS